MTKKPQVEFYVGQNTDVLKDLRRNSVHAVITSPPYWGLRDYGLTPVVWADGTECCLGLESTPDLFIEHLCQTFDAVIPILRPDGTCWVNLGDCYYNYRVGNNGGMPGQTVHKGEQRAKPTAEQGCARRTTKQVGLKEKDLVGIPWRFAFAMQSRGWYLRAAIPWIKRNVMPSSVRDRPTTGIEYVFMFAHPASGGRYFYDVEATRTGAVRGAAGSRFDQGKTGTTQRRTQAGPRESDGAPTRNRRDTDWFFDSLRNILEGGEALLHPAPEEDEETPEPGTISDEHPVPLALVVNPRPFKEAHFAVFAPQFVTPMILASTSEKGCCGTCGAPWVRIMEEKSQGNAYGAGGGIKAETAEAARLAGGIGRLDAGRRAVEGSTFNNNPNKRPPPPATLGWKPSCSCPPTEPVPAVVLDPFGGSGTTALTSLNLGRSSIYIDASETYCDEIAMPRIRAGVAALART